MSTKEAGKIEPRADAPKQQLNSLTGLRWIAAFLVWARHTETIVNGHGSAWWHRLTAPGATGVSFFFILSGFVLAWSFRPGITRRRFIQLRLSRIYPAYAVAGLVVIPALAVTSALNLKSLVASGFAFSLGQAWIPLNGVYFGGDGVAWSLSAELFFYLCMPAIAGYLLTHRDRRWQVLVGAVVVSCAVPLLVRAKTDGVGLGYWLIYICPAYRIFEFIAGVCLGLLIRDGWRLRLPIPAALSLCLAGYVAAMWLPLYLSWVVATIVPFCLLIASAATSDLEGRGGWLSSRAFITLGRWSYCFYLVHAIIIGLIQHSYASTHHGSAVEVSAVVGSLLLSVAVAAILYGLIEQPAERKLRMVI